MKTIVFTGGGSGGHIYPGLAIIDELCALSPDISIVWIGSSNSRDKDMVLSNIGHEGKLSCKRFIGVPSGKLRRYFSFQNFIDVFKIGFSFIASLFHLAHLKPVALFSKGGFVSVPPCAAAKLLRIPVYTHECDFSPGLATRLNMRFAKRVLLSYEESRDFFPASLQKNITVTGNPVRYIFWKADAKQGHDFFALANPLKKPILLVLGGSSGARQINNLVFHNLKWLVERFVVVHQTGVGEGYENACAIKNTLSYENDEVYLPFDFIYAEMPHVLVASDIVLSRAGANSLWECAVAGKPMVLVPLSGSGTRGDQVENAAFFEQRGAAIVLDSSEKSEEKLSANLQMALEALASDTQRAGYVSAALSLVQKNPAENIAQLLYNEVLCNT